jgi:hypothetical protein
MLHYGRTGRFEDLERWSARLIALVDNPDFENDRAIRRLEAQGAVNATYHYGEASRFDDMERFGKRLVKLADDPRFAGEPVIRLCEASGADNCMLYYGQAGRFEDLERWGRRLTALADDDRFADDPAFRLCEAKGAHNAIIHYGTGPSWSRWRERLAVVSLAFPYHPEIQHRANAHNLAILQQKAVGWRYGKPKVPGPDW